jgi:chromosome segregation ATPase
MEHTSNRMTTAEKVAATAADPQQKGGMEAAVKETVAREVAAVLKRVRKSNTMAYAGNKPTEMLRALQDIEVHYKEALEEKVWEIIQMRQSNEGLTRKMVEAERTRVEVVSLAKAREEEWLERERRLGEAEDKAMALEAKVRGLIHHEEIAHTNQGVMAELRTRLAEEQQRHAACVEELGETKLALARVRSTGELQREELQRQLRAASSEARVLRKEVSALQITLENRDEQIKRWASGLAAGEGGEGEGRLAQAESEREKLRDEIRGLHYELTHKEEKMAEAVGMLDMLVAVLVQSAAVMVRHGGGHERLPDFLAGARPRYMLSLHKPS